MGSRRKKAAKRSKREPPHDLSDQVERRDSIAPDKGKGAAGGTWFGAKRPVLRFVILFGVILGALSACTITDFAQHHVWPAHLSLNARWSAAVLTLLGQDARAMGSSISSAACSLQIAKGCDAVHPSALYVAAVLAFPASIRARLWGALAGTLLLLAVNLARIVSLFFVKLHFPRAFETVHLEVWQVLFVFLALLLWAIWARWAVRRSRVPGPHGSV